MEPITIAIVAITAVLAGLCGYFFANNRSAKTQASLEASLQQTAELLEHARQDLQNSEAETKSLTGKLSVSDQEKAALKANLDNSETAYQQEKDKSATLEHKLEEATTNKHDAEKENKTAQADVRSLKEQAKDLQERLENTERLLNQERTNTDDLKTKLAEEGKRAEGLNANLEKSREHFAELRENYQTEKDGREQLQQKYNSLNSEYTELKTSQDEREASHERELANFNKQKEELKKDFENLASKILKENGKAFSENSKQQLDHLLNPFKQQIDGFQKRINEVHDASVKGSANLNAEIKKVLDVGLKMQDEAANLSTALRGDKKALGTWSEVQAEILLEMSGLQEGREFHREANFKTEEGKDQRPDFVVNLPNDKHLIVDSKMSLNAYVDATAAETEEERQVHMKAHVQAIRKHVKDLSDKNYPKLKGINTPEYVFMFIGNEPAYLAAFDHDPNLFQEAYRKGIAIVTPNTLLSSLRIVSHLWSIDKQNSNTKELAEHASKVYDKLRVFAEKMEKLGRQIDTVHKSYSDSWSTLKDGKGSLSKQVSKFVDMGVSVKEKLPASLTENRDIDLLPDTEETTELNEDSEFASQLEETSPAAQNQSELTNTTKEVETD